MCASLIMRAHAQMLITVFVDHMAREWYFLCMLNKWRSIMSSILEQWSHNRPIGRPRVVTSSPTTTGRTILATQTLIYLVSIVQLNHRVYRPCMIILREPVTFDSVASGNMAWVAEESKNENLDTCEIYAQKLYYDSQAQVETSLHSFSIISIKSWNLNQHTLCRHNNNCLGENNHTDSWLRWGIELI